MIYERAQDPTPQSGRITDAFPLSDRNPAMFPTDPASIKLARRNGGTNLHVRWMINRDIPEVLQLFQTKDPQTSLPAIDLKAIQAEIMRGRAARNIISQVAENGIKVVGFTMYELAKDHLNIMWLIGAKGYNGAPEEALLSKLISKLSSHRRTSLVMRISARISIKNIKFIQKYGFEFQGSETDQDGEWYIFRYYQHEMPDDEQEINPPTAPVEPVDMLGDDDDDEPNFELAFDDD